jgi:hypothetical protein
MSTNARIAIQLSDKPGYYVSVYHHWDGYPQWLGKTLGEHFNSRKLASELIDGGDMSSCWTNCGWNNETRPETGPLYYSERGEDCPPKVAATVDKLFEQCDNCGAEYVYIYTPKYGWIAHNVYAYFSDPIIMSLFCQSAAD